LALAGFGVSLLLPTNPLPTGASDAAAVAVAGALDAAA
jgi:hypothetical protein